MAEEEEEGLTFGLSRAVTRKGFAGMCRECDPCVLTGSCNPETASNELWAPVWGFGWRGLSQVGTEPEPGTGPWEMGMAKPGMNKIRNDHTKPGNEQNQE